MSSMAKCCWLVITSQRVLFNDCMERSGWFVDGDKECLKEAEKMHSLLQVVVRESIIDKLEKSEYRFPSVGKNEVKTSSWALRWC